MKRFFTAPLLAVAALLSCGLVAENPSPPAGKVQPVTGAKHFEKILESSGKQLLIFDLYAEWCGPCRMLAPILAEVAKETKDLAAVYKIDTDQHPDLASAFRVSGIPHVAFVKNKKVVLVLTGLREKAAYLEAIRKFAEPPAKPLEKKKETVFRESGAVAGG